MPTPRRPESSLAPYPMPSIDFGAAPGADRLILAGLPDAVLILDPLGVVSDGNAAAERLFERSLSALRNSPIDRLVTLPDAGAGRGGLGGRLRTPARPPIERWQGCRGHGLDGREFPCDIALGTLATGAPGRFVLQVQATGAREFEASQRRESAKMSAVATLATAIANDFNNALAAINGSIEAARLRIASQDRPPPRELLDAKEATQGAARLVRRLLNFARPTPGFRRPADPGALLEEAARVLRRDLDPRITLVTRVDHGDWCIMADVEQVTDLVVSLGLNAMEAMPTGGILTLSSARAAAGVFGLGAPEAANGREYVRLDVRDTGVGIPPEILPRIFEPFYTTKEAGRGSGLGLATAYGVLRHHEGGITVESAPGAGTTFQVFLPRSHAACPVPVVAPALELGTGNGRILLVDDDAAVRRPLCQALGLCGYTVVEARDGMEALRVMGDDRTAVDLVLLDVKMPGMSGWDVLAELRRRVPALPVILTSGYTHEDSAPPADAPIPDAYLPKPYDLAELTTVVRRLLLPRRPADTQA
ncbi:MAG: response regulator [Gemmatimonadales bacterium]